MKKLFYVAALFAAVSFTACGNNNGENKEGEGEHKCCKHHHEGEEGEHKCCKMHEGEEGEHHCCKHHHEGEAGEHKCCHQHEGEAGEHKCCHHHDAEPAMNPEGQE